ncbi:MetQ/NlpA family ABC transporter substrate-binding protein [Bacillus sp. B-jedd]|uniref:MetQ/NlpA family ABC transporter substrate-binding protein n=1 Tax=Bacillus sp. B-jedd TaxID=1476857 RepID=UPI0005155978|nr:MetQ/NlpA family ABC transporter substrate-binding protein [Bacillus sp. B-jedd]CEG26931.1 putative ABC solute binding periplasmic lipoprotein [Bacillus sp. B-jedd]
MRKVLLSLILVLCLGVLAACGGSGQTSKGGEIGEKKDIKIGATAGPYSDMVTKAIKPVLEKKGYKVEVVEFSDYVQPNLALGNGDLDANLFQHKIYMENFAKENKLELSELVIVPTAPMGIFSNKFKSVGDVADGSTVSLPNDPTNLARALGVLEDAKLITIDSSIDPLKASEKDVKDNPKKLKFTPIEAAQLPRSVESVDLALVPGNFALAAKMNLLDALQLENMPDDYRNRVVVNTKDLDSQLAKDLKAAVESEDFEMTIDSDFQGFGKPEWMKNR